MEDSKQDNRKKAMEWWTTLSLEQQFYATIEHNDLIVGDRTRHPHTLTGSEIELIYNAKLISSTKPIITVQTTCNNCGSIKDGVETGICIHCGKFGKTEPNIRSNTPIACRVYRSRNPTYLNPSFIGRGKTVSSKDIPISYTEKEVIALLEKYDREFKIDTFAYTKPANYTVMDWFTKNKKQ